MGNGIFEKLEDMKMGALASFSLVLLISIARYLLECLVAHYHEPPLQVAESVLDAASFYVQMFVLFLAGQKLFLKKISYVPIVIGVLTGVIPPIADYLLGVKNPVYFYFAPNLLFLGQGVTPGEPIAIWAAIALFAAYIAARRNNALFAIPAALFGWFAIQFAFSAHPLLSTFVQSQLISFNWPLVGFATRSLFILLPMAYLDEEFRKFLMYRASRFFLVLCLCIFAVSLFRSELVQSFSLLIENLMAFALIFMFNTRGDEAEDSMNKRRSFSLGRLAWAATVFLIAADFGLAYVFGLGIEAFCLPLLVVFLGFLYSRPLKLKRVFPLAYVLEGLFFSLIFISFAFLSQQQPDAVWLAARFMICFGVFAIGGAIKDYKDVPGDRAAGVPTAFTLVPENLSNQFWLGFRALLVLGPILFVVLETGNITPFQQLFCGIFAIMASWLLFFAKTADREALVNNYIILFSALILAVSIA